MGRNRAAMFRIMIADVNVRMRAEFSRPGAIPAVPAIAQPVSDSRELVENPIGAHQGPNVPPPLLIRVSTGAEISLFWPLENHRAG